MIRAQSSVLYGSARRIAVAIGGTAVLIVGALMLFLPGPAVIVLPAGLAILGLEFDWAKRWHEALRHRSARVFEMWRRSGARDRASET